MTDDKNTYFAPLPPVTETQLADARAEIARQAAEIERLQALLIVDACDGNIGEAGRAWMAHCKELADECFRHKAEIHRLQAQADVEREIAATHMAQANRQAAEIERLQALLDVYACDGNIGEAPT